VTRMSSRRSACASRRPDPPRARGSEDVTFRTLRAYPQR
jgi:hypothetical protein